MKGWTNKILKYDMKETCLYVFKNQHRQLKIFEVIIFKLEVKSPNVKQKKFEVKSCNIRRKLSP